LLDFTPGSGVPDGLWGAACDYGETDAEIALEWAVRFHRDVLNGGLQQATYNQRVRIDTCVAAYEFFGLRDALACVRRAITYRCSVTHSEWGYEEGEESVCEELDEHYVASVYGSGRNRPDQVEAAIISYVVAHRDAYERLVEICDAAS
jgi:hypothetical protein